MNPDALAPNSHTIVQIKSATTGEVLFAVPLSPKGEFDFESIPAGKFRLILVSKKGSELRRLPLADQPKEIRCKDQKDCRVDSTITFHGTENPLEFCPPK